MIIVTVADGFQEDYGQSIGRIAEKHFQELGLDIGEIVELISGTQRIGVFLRGLEEVENSKILQRSIYRSDEVFKRRSDEKPIILYLNGFLRASLKIGIGQKVRLDKTSPPEADTVLIAPLNSEDKEKVYIEYLLNRPVIRGQIIELQNIGYDLKAAILKTNPPGIVRISATSDVRITNDPPPELVKNNENYVSYDDIGGFREIIQRVRTLVEFPLRYPEVFELLNVDPPRGILITGPSGIGKTYLAKAISCESGVTRFFVMAPEIIKGWWTAEQEMDKYFQHVLKFEPSILVIDQIETLAPTPTPNLSDLEIRMTERFIRNLDALKGRKVVVISTTSNPNDIHPALRAYGRFEIEIPLKIPDFKDRSEILAIQTRGLPLSASIEIPTLAQATSGFTPADLELLVKEAGMHALERTNLLDLDTKVSSTAQLIKSEVIMVELVMEDFTKALATVKPSAGREIINEIPKVKWSDIGGLNDVKQSLKEMIEWPINHTHVFEEMGIRIPRGVLLYGPPGTGKTLIAKAMANEISANFIVVKGPELLSKWFSESARMVRELFSRARALAPCIVFFDEIDAIATKRGGGFSSSTSRERDRVINQLLASLDGIDKMKGVFVVCATNRPNMLDPALIRPGRLDRLIYVPVPNFEGRIQILEVHTRNMPHDLAKKVSLHDLASKTDGFTGADLENLCREAAYSCLRRDSSLISSDDFENSLKICSPSVSKDLARFYQIQEGIMKKKKLIEYTKYYQEYA